MEQKRREAFFLCILIQLHSWAVCKTKRLRKETTVRMAGPILRSRFRPVLATIAWDGNAGPFPGQESAHPHLKTDGASSHAVGEIVTGNRAPKNDHQKQSIAIKVQTHYAELLTAVIEYKQLIETSNLQQNASVHLCCDACRTS